MKKLNMKKAKQKKECVDFNSFCRRYECEKCPYDDYCKTIDDCRERYLSLKWPEDTEED